MSLLPVLRQLDLSHNKINHLDLQLVTSPSLKTLLLASNDIYLISATDKPIDNLKNLNLSHNKIQNVEGLLCCQGLEDLNVTYNNIALIGEVRVLASLSHLRKLSVDGNHFAKKKRHRIIIFAYFRDKELLLDKKPVSRKEKAKIDAKVAALERFQDIDDSLSSISTVSDDSVTDSGIDHTNWVSNLASLSEIEESDYEVVPNIYWDEIHGASGGSESSSTTSSSEIEQQHNEENFSREDWDRLIHANTKKLLIPPRARQETRESAASERTLCPNSRHDTIKNDNIDVVSTRVNSGVKQKQKRISVVKEDITTDDSNIPGPSNAHIVDEESCQRKKTSWVSSLFRKPGSLPRNTSKFTAFEGEKVDEPHGSACSPLGGIDEIHEYKVDENEVSKSFDDNCEFERAKECNEVDDCSLESSDDEN